MGQPFDPHYHEALMQVPAEGRPPGSVAQELKVGFVMGDVVIRPSQVVVTANEQPKQAEPDDAPDAEPEA